ncbi:MAG: DUF4962 domain-containing protein, partial [Lentisphaerae bacterium]|nr:DUF4962 domain-containing protein [Lentisphaerota bacterium]
MLPAASTAAANPVNASRANAAAPSRRRCRPGRRRVLTVLLGLLVGLAVRGQGVRLHLDFEDGRGPGSHPALEGSRGIVATLVDGAPGAGKALELHNPEPASQCGVVLRQPFTVTKNLVLEFDHREEIEDGFEGAYLGVAFMGEDGQQVCWASDPFSSTWRRARIVIPSLRPSSGAAMQIGLPIATVRLYGRVKDTTDQRGATRGRMRVWLDNLRLHVPDAIDMAGLGKPYVCHNNPPLLDWAGPGRPGQRLQLSRSADFPAAATREVEVPGARPFLVPSEPLEPGTWYFRVLIEDALVSGWSQAQPVEIPAETHHYRLAPIAMAPLRQAPRPRLRRLLRPAGEALTPTEAETLLRNARAALEQGVPEHPGPYRSGDPRWPQWIDWYGRVAGDITSRTGSRLASAGRAAILTGDAAAIDAARKLLVAACAWDPDGGSSARHGDLQAASLLQGMLWCYDACAGSLSAAEAATVEAVLKTRIQQFAGHLSPFRMNPSQNHPWRQTTAVAEAALVMMGVFPEAEEWLDVACHACAYRILPSMGFAGENQEGLSYWSYGVSMLADLADLMRFLGGVDLYDHPWLASTCRFPIYTAPPGGYAISFADNSDRGNASLRGPYGTSLAGRLGERVGDPYALWYASRSAAGVTPRPPADLPQSVFYPYIGYALFNTCLSEGRENVSVGLRCGPYYAGHQHDDNNGFAIHAYGDKLAVDGGYYDWYGSPHFKAYSMRTLAHNTLLVDGEGQVPRTGGRLAESFDSPGIGWTVGDASDPSIYGGRLRRFERRLLFLKPDAVVIHDLVEASAASARLDWLLHAHTTEAFPCDAAAGSFQIERPNAALQGRFLAPAGLTMAVTQSFTIGPQQKRASVFLPWDEVQPEWTLTASAPAAPRQEFVAVMVVHRRGDGVTAAPALVRPLASDAGWGCEIERPYGRWRVLLRRQGADGPMAADGLQSDGTAAAVLVDPSGAVANAFMAGGRSLTHEGNALLSRPAPSDAALDEGVQPAALEAVMAFDDRELPVAGLRRSLPDGDLSVWWVTLDLPEAYRGDLEIEGWTGALPPQVRLGPMAFTGIRH